MQHTAVVQGIQNALEKIASAPNRTLGHQAPAGMIMKIARVKVSMSVVMQERTLNRMRRVIANAPGLAITIYIRVTGAVATLLSAPIRNALSLKATPAPPASTTTG